MSFSIMEITSTHPQDISTCPLTGLSIRLPSKEYNQKVLLSHIKLTPSLYLIIPVLYAQAGEGERKVLSHY